MFFTMVQNPKFNAYSAYSKITSPNSSSWTKLESCSREIYLITDRMTKTADGGGCSNPDLAELADIFEG